MLYFSDFLWHYMIHVGVYLDCATRLKDITVGGYGTQRSDTIARKFLRIAEAAPSCYIIERPIGFETQRSM